MEQTNLQPDLEAITRQLKLDIQRRTKELVKRGPTPEHNPTKLKGIGYTRKNKSLSKAKLAIQKNSKKLNRNKKRHHMTAKEKKSR